MRPNFVSASYTSGLILKGFPETVPARLGCAWDGRRPRSVLCFLPYFDQHGDLAPARRKGRTMAEKLESGLTREQAFELLGTYNDDPFHISHGETLEGLMRYYAEREDPENVEFWGQVGLLHDLDWERWQDSETHTVKTAELLAEAGADPALAKSIQTHNSPNNPDLPKPELTMEKWLFATDELSGLIQAAAKMRPSGSVTDMEVKSLKKKFKAKAFAAGCDRDIIAQGAELLGMDLNELFASVLDAMKAIAPVGDIYAK